MYRIEKRFTLPIGHRLSKHKGRCYSLHGHNFTILVGMQANELNSDDMVMDFSLLKTMVNDFLDSLDHCMLLNEKDKDMIEQFEGKGFRVKQVPYDPTAEKLAETIFKSLQQSDGIRVYVEYVTVYENENSKATYSLK